MSTHYRVIIIWLSKQCLEIGYCTQQCMQHVLLLVLYYIPSGCMHHTCRCLHYHLTGFRLTRQTRLFYVVILFYGEQPYRSAVQHVLIQVMCAMTHCIAIFVSTSYSSHILFPKYVVVLSLRTVVLYFIYYFSICI